MKKYFSLHRGGKAWSKNARAWTSKDRQWKVAVGRRNVDKRNGYVWHGEAKAKASIVRQGQRQVW